jgi:hypothetical protein
MKSKLILSVVAVGAFGCLLSCQQALGIPVPSTGTSILVNVIPGGNLTVDWSVTSVGVGDYLYSYTVPPPAGGLSAYTVLFDDKPGIVFDVLGGTANNQVLGVGVNWTFNPVSTNSQTVSFESMLPPVLGNDQAQDGSVYTSVLLGGTPAPVPGVPDGGLTVTLLGFALVGVEGLRRKLTR